MVLCFPPNLFPAPSLPVFCHEGLWLEFSSQSWIRRAVPMGCPCVLQGAHWSHWALIGAFFPSPAYSRIQQCFRLALPFFFQNFSQLLSIPGKRETGMASSFFPGQQDLLSYCRHTIVLSHFLESFFQAEKLNPSGYLRDD